MAGGKERKTRGKSPLEDHGKLSGDGGRHKKGVLMFRKSGEGRRLLLGKKKKNEGF